MERIDESYHILSDPGTDLESWTLKCSDCNMVFGNPSLLQKHKARFCVGSHPEDVEALRLRRQEPKHSPRKAYPDEEETPRFDVTKDVRVQQLAESHGRQMEFLANRNRELEEQREEIRRQLEALSQRQPIKDDATEEMLKELREQEERSRKMLEELCRQLAEARRPVNIIEADQPETQTTSRYYPTIYGSSLVQEIMAVKESYIKNGGCDPDILSHLEQLLAEAHAVEESLRNMPQKPPKEKEDSSELISVEMENKRLLEQLIQLQEQKILNKRSRDSREGELEHELRRMRRDHLRKIHEMQLQIERMRQDSMLDRMFLEIQLRNQTAAAPPPTKLILKQRPPPPPAPARPVTQTETLDVTLPYDEDSSPRRIHMYGHTWVHTQHRQDVEEDPEYDLDL